MFQNPVKMNINYKKYITNFCLKKCELPKYTMTGWCSLILLNDIYLGGKNDELVNNYYTIKFKLYVDLCFITKSVLLVLSASKPSYVKIMSMPLGL